MKKDKIIKLLTTRRKRMIDNNEINQAGKIARIIKGIEADQLKDFDTLKNAGLNNNSYR